MPRFFLIAGCFVAAWLVVWTALLLFGDALRTDRIADSLTGDDATVNLALAVIATLLFALAVLRAGWIRRQ